VAKFMETNGSKGDYSEELMDELDKAVSYYIYRTNQLVNHRLTPDNVVELKITLADTNDGRGHHIVTLTTTVWGDS
jgi:hypothetical protein